MTGKTPPPLPPLHSAPGKYGAAGTVPPLEPPAPLTARLSSSGRFRDWSSCRLRELPSWLASMVLHMAFVVLIASLAIPEAPRSVFGQLVAVFQQGEPEELNEPPVLEMDANDRVDTPMGDRSLKDDGKKKEELQKAAKVESPPSGRDASAKKNQPAQEAAAKPKQKPAQAGKPHEPVRLNDAGAADYGPRGPNESAEQAKRLDETVHQFILYDINELRGREGQEALIEFKDLGPEAIPALVRGLNKATHYRSSCPVIVIGRKLDQALRNTNDAALIRYAVENIGRGIPENANHYYVLRNLVAKWGGERDRLRTELNSIAATGLKVDDKLLDEYRKLRRDSLDKLYARAGDSSDRELRMLALLLITQRISSRSFREHPRVVTANRMISLLEDSDKTVRAVAKAALVTLSGGKNFGPRNIGDEADLAPAARRWKVYWDQRSKRTLESPAKTLLNRAKVLQKVGKVAAASRRFREIVKEFPSTDAARQARGLLGIRAD